MCVYVRAHRRHKRYLSLDFFPLIASILTSVVSCTVQLYLRHYVIVILIFSAICFARQSRLKVTLAIIIVKSVIIGINNLVKLLKLLDLLIILSA